MRRHVAAIRIGVPVLLVLATGALSAQSTRPSPRELARRAAHGRALGQLGRSGLRSLLSASGGLGDLQNRAGSYRTAVQRERARTAALEGRLEALESGLADPGLPPQERAVLQELREATRAELGAVPAYEASYRTATARVDALRPAGFLGDEPLFLWVRGRGHVRWDGEDGLTVFSERVSAGPLLAWDGWIASPGVGLARRDVEIEPFDGHAGGTSVGPELHLGRVLGDGWSAALRLTHAWSWDRTEIQRPGPRGTTGVTTDRVTRTVSAKLELLGRVTVVPAAAGGLSVRPRAGLYLASRHTPPAVHGLGERTGGAFGERETVAALRSGASFGTRLGAWRPTAYVGWEREFARGTGTPIDDPEAVLGEVGMSWSWGRGRRLSLDYALLRGLDGLREATELTLVAIFDG